MIVDSGVRWLLLKCLCSAILTIQIKYLPANISAYIIASIPPLFAFAFVGLRAMKKRQIPSTQNKHLYALRAALGLGSMLLFIYAIQHMPISQVAAINYTAPLFTALLAIILLKEKPTLYHAIALSICFVGCLIIVKPTGGLTNIVLLMFGSAALYGGVGIIIKILTSTDDNHTVSFYTWLYIALLATPLAVIYWQPLDINALMSLAALGITSNILIVAAYKAYSQSRMVDLMPYEYSNILFVIGLLYVLFDTPIDHLSALGALIILSGCIILKKQPCVN